MYPVVLVLRDAKYSDLDSHFQGVNFTAKITEKNQDVKLLYNEHYNVLLTIGQDWHEYDIQKYMIKKSFAKWIHFKPDEVSKATLEHKVLSCYIANLPKRIDFRPQVSAFTPSYKSGDKILRPLRSLLAQKMQDWEWVILVDGYDRIEFADKLTDPRIRIYYRHENSGSIGNVKNEACGLSRGQYLLELDHDDDILPDCLGDICKGFESHPEAGFIYMSFAEIFEDWTNWFYCEGWGMGRYGSYYRQNVNGNWVYAAICPPINNVTMADITSVPNHPRVWRKSVLDQIGGYSESIPVADDYEVLLKTMLHTQMLYIPKLAYIQYKNNGGNNFSLIRNGEIFKLEKCISNDYRARFEEFYKDKPKGVYGDVIWKRDSDSLGGNINIVHNFDYDMTVLVKSTEGLSKIDEYLKNPRCDIILVLCFDLSTQSILTQLGLTYIKYHILPGASDVEIENYFHRCYCTTEKWVIIE